MLMKKLDLQNHFRIIAIYNIDTGQILRIFVTQPDRMYFFRSDFYWHPFIHITQTIQSALNYEVHIFRLSLTHCVSRFFKLILLLQMI